jgi:intraflagellar transport protein 80
MNPGHKRKKTKLASMTDSFLWNDKNDVLCAISDTRLITWFYPNAVEVDKEIMAMTKSVKETNDIGRLA